MTHRQAEVWGEWMAGEWDRLPLDLRYLQLIATEVRRSWVRRPKNVEMTDLQLRPKGASTSKYDKMTPEEASRHMKAAHMMKFGSAGMTRMTKAEAIKAGIIPPDEITQ